MTITNNTKVHLTVVISSVSLAIYGTVLYENLCYKIDQSMTIQQFQEWKDKASDINNTAYPAFKWPSIPAKQYSSFLMYKSTALANLKP